MRMVQGTNKFSSNFSSSGDFAKFAWCRWIQEKLNNLCILSCFSKQRWRSLIKIKRCFKFGFISLKMWKPFPISRARISTIPYLEGNRSIEEHHKSYERVDSWVALFTNRVWPAIFLINEQKGLLSLFDKLCPPFLCYLAKISSPCAKTDSIIMKVMWK